MKEGKGPFVQCFNGQHEVLTNLISIESTQTHVFKQLFRDERTGFYDQNKNSNGCLNRIGTCRGVITFLLRMCRLFADAVNYY